MWLEKMNVKSFNVELFLLEPREFGLFYNLIDNLTHNTTFCYCYWAVNWKKKKQFFYVFL